MQKLKRNKSYAQKKLIAKLTFISWVSYSKFICSTIALNVNSIKNYRNEVWTKLFVEVCFRQDKHIHRVSSEHS